MHSAHLLFVVAAALFASPLSTCFSSGRSQVCPVWDLDSKSASRLTDANKGKSFLLFHYSNSCPHCQLPKGFIDKFKFDPNRLEIAKSQDTGLVEKVIGMRSDGIPTFYLFKKGTSKAIEYVGTPSEERLQHWLDEQLK